MEPLSNQVPQSNILYDIMESKNYISCTFLDKCLSSISRLVMNTSMPFVKRIHKVLGYKVHYDFSLDYSIDPHTDAVVPSNQNVITYEEG